MCTHCIGKFSEVNDQEKCKLIFTKNFKSLNFDAFTFKVSKSQIATI